MNAGDLVEVDFGEPVGSEPGFRRPAIVVTANAVLARQPRTIHVVPVTGTVDRALSTELRVDSDALDRPSAAQCHSLDIISVARIVEELGDNVGAVSLAQIRAIIADLLDIP